MNTKASATATRLAREGYARARSDDIAVAYGVSPSRARHMRTDEASKSELASLLRIVLDGPEKLARGIVEAVERAWESRPLQSADTPVLLNRLVYLWHREHETDAEEDRQAALYLAGGSIESYRGALCTQAETHREIRELIVELEWRGVDTRTAIANGGDQ